MATGGVAAWGHGHYGRGQACAACAACASDPEKVAVTFSPSRRILGVLQAVRAVPRRRPAHPAPRPAALTRRNKSDLRRTALPVPVGSSTGERALPP